jgi:integrase
MRMINRLSAVQVSKISEPGRYGDGGGLWLQVSKARRGGDHVTKSWIFRYMIEGKARSMGLGDLATFSLKEARERARNARQMVADGIDPLEAKHATRAAARAEDAGKISFADAAARYIKTHAAGWRNAKHGEQWKNTLKTYADPVIGQLSVADVETAHIMTILEPIWTAKTETASRVRGRIESVLDWATARGYRKGDNPARWRGHLDQLLPARGKVAKVKHHGALPYADLPEFMAALRSMQSVSARALEFTILTAARTGETIGARWSEIDLEAKIWTVPGDRMKSGRAHRVPLSDQAFAIIEAMPREGEGDGFIFPGGRKGRGLSQMAMLELLRGMDGMQGFTVHGFRSTFRDWAAEQTNFPRDLAEAALAHAVADKVEAAYRRGDAIEKRRRMMDAWQRFAAQPTDGGKVVKLARGAA